MDRQRRALALALGLLCALLLLAGASAGAGPGTEGGLIADLRRSQETLGIPGQVVRAEVLRSQDSRMEGAEIQTLQVRVTAEEGEVAWTGVCTLTYTAKGLGWTLAGAEVAEEWRASPRSGVDEETVRASLRACREEGSYDQVAVVGRNTDLEAGTDQIWIRAVHHGQAGIQDVILTFRWRFDPDLPGYVLVEKAGSKQREAQRCASRCFDICCYRTSSPRRASRFIWRFRLAEAASMADRVTGSPSAMALR